MPGVLHPSQKLWEKIKLYIKIEYFIRRYVHALTEHEQNQFKLQYSQWVLSNMDSEQSVPCPDIMWFVNAAWLSGAR
jgi:hypothetical protein